MRYDNPESEGYFGRLLDLVEYDGDEYLMKQLHQTYFVWVIPMDDNRAEDGLELRSRLDYISDEDCSVLEMLIALAERASHQYGGSPLEWFGTFLENLDLLQFTDGSVYNEYYVDEILHKWMTRDIQPDGSGGLFPLRHPPQDQRETEIWYQMSAYIIEEMDAEGFFD